MRQTPTRQSFPQVNFGKFWENNNLEKVGLGNE